MNWKRANLQVTFSLPIIMPASNYSCVLGFEELRGISSFCFVYLPYDSELIQRLRDGIDDSKNLCNERNAPETDTSNPWISFLLFMV